MTGLLTAALFFVIALIYGSVGFGGGSSYTALLTLSDLKPGWIPPVSLACNILVVAGSTVHFARHGHIVARLVWPFLLGSVPCAFLGGRWPIRQETFLAMLGVSLLLAGVALLARRREYTEAGGPPSLPAGLGVGAALGLLSGLVGIGGGIFLAPLMLLRRWGTPKQVAAASALFILANSLSGLAGQLVKIGTAEPLADRWMLFVAVVVGGQLGSSLGAGPFPQRLVRSITGMLVVAAGARVLYRLFAA